MSACRIVITGCLVPAILLDDGGPTFVQKQTSSTIVWPHITSQLKLSLQTTKTASHAFGLTNRSRRGNILNSRVSHWIEVCGGVAVGRKQPTGSINPLTMRLLDIWVGKPLCAFLTLARAFARLIGLERVYTQPPHRILFIKLIEQGATVLAYDAVRRAQELVGRENVYFCVLQSNREILDLMGLIPPENVLAIRSESLLLFFIDTIRTLRRARLLSIDAVIDMEFFSRAPAVLAYLTGAKYRVGIHRFTAELPYRGDLMTHRVSYNPYLPVATAYRMLVETLMLNPSDKPFPKLSPICVTEPPPQFVPTREEQESVYQMLDSAAHREVRKPIVILNPNASDIIPLRKWPTEHFIELGNRLVQSRPDINIVITGSPAEAAAGKEIAHAIGEDHAVSVAGLTTLRELVVLYTLADVMITNDSGPAHFACLTDIDIVVLFGPETPMLYGPLGDHAHVIWAGLACSPCVSAFNHRLSPCRDNVCMRAITVEQVYTKTMELLERRKDG